MTTRTLLGLTIATCLALWAADFHPLDVKTGEWESTVIIDMNGPPPIPAEMLARMTPEQRAKFEERTKSLSGRPTVSKYCITKDKLDKPLLWGKDDKACSYSLATSTGSAQEIHVACSNERMKSSGTIRIQALDSENVKGSTHITMTSGDRTTNINSSITAKWVGPACSSNK